jgi:hypothetical protein
VLSYDLYGFEVCNRFNYGDTKTTMYHHNTSIMMMAYFLFGSKERVVWKFDRPSGYESQFLLKSYNAKKFKDRIWVSETTLFIYAICLDPC